MKKILLSILFFTLFASAFGQPKVNRSSQANTVMDSRWGAILNAITPRYPDTSAANLTVNIGIDSAGAIISLYNNTFWFRENNPKRWVRIVTGTVETTDSLFGVQDNVYTSNRQNYMGGFRHSLDSGKVVIGGSRNTPNDSVFLVTKGVTPILRVDNVFGKVHTLEFGAYNDAFVVNGAAAGFQNNYPVFWSNGAYILPYQQPLTINRGHPRIQVNGERANVIITNDTLTSKNGDSLDYYPFQIRFRSFVDNIERTRFLINNEGSIWSNKYPSGIGGSTDSALVLKNGVISAVPYSTFGGGGGGGTVTDFTFTNANGFSGVVNTSTSTPDLTLSTLIGDNQVVVASGGALTGSNTFTRTPATIYGYTTNDVNFEAENGSDLNGLQITPTKSLFYNISASTNTVETVLELKRFTGTSANGIGGSLDYITEDDGGSLIRSNRLQSRYTSVTSGATTSEFSISGRNAGTEQTILTLAGSGAVKLQSGYGTNTFTGTTAYALGVDASSNVVTYPIGGNSSFTFVDSLQWIYSVAYGLVGDGVTDNITGMRAMRNAAAITGRPILFAPGIYYASDSVTFDKMVIAGFNTTIKSTSNTVTIFNIEDSCEVYGFTFIGNGRAAALPGGVFTLQDGIRVFGNKNNIHDNRMYSMNGAGIALWASSIFYNNRIVNNIMNGNTIGIYALVNSEYTTAIGNKGEYNFVGIYDRASSNNQWLGNTFNYSLNSNFRLLGGGDHGMAEGNTFNHGVGYNLLIESCTLNFAFTGNIFYTGDIGFGTVDTVHNVIIQGGTISGATISGTRNVNVRISDNIYGSGAVVQTTTGVDYFNNINSTDPVYVSTKASSLTSAQLSSMLTDETGSTGNVVFSGSPTITTPTFVTSAIMPLGIGSTSANGTITFQGNNAGAGNTATNDNILFRVGNTPTTAMRIDNTGNIGINTVTTSSFKVFLVSIGATNSTGYLLARNTSSQNVFQGSDNGDHKIGNQSTTTSVTNLINRTFAGPGLTAPTAWLTLGAGTTAVQTAPLKFLTGTSMTSPEAGAVEYTTDDLFFTLSTGTARKRFLFADPVGGLTSGRVTFATTNGRATDAAELTWNGTGLGVGGSAGSSYNLSVTGTTATLAGLRVLSTIAPAVSGDGFGTYINPGFTEQGSGTHAMFASLRLAAPNVTAGAGALTRTAAIYMTDNSNGTVTDDNYAIYSLLSGPSVLNGSLSLATIGNKLSIATGSNASVGSATLVAGTVTINTTAVTASSLIFVTYDTPAGTLGAALSVPSASIVAGTSFVINSISTAGVVVITDISSVRWWVIN